MVQLGVGRKDAVGSRPNNVSILLLHKVTQRPLDERHLNCEGQKQGYLLQQIALEYRSLESVKIA